MTQDKKTTVTQATNILEPLCGEATVEAWLWRPPPGFNDIQYYTSTTYYT